MRVLQVIPFFFCAIYYALGLSCYQCYTAKECMSPTKAMCPADKPYCVSVGVSDMYAYSKGCSDQSKACDVMDQNGNPIYDQCEVCQEDLCNTKEFT